MMALRTVDDLSLLTESVELECKLAGGQDGKGELPKDFWLSYSAMANTHGGTVLLGVREKRGEFAVAGIENIDKVRQDLFSTLNNRSKVSVNLLTDDDVTVCHVEGKAVMVITIPAATRKQKPVFLNGQPLSNTYRRFNDGDHRCDDETVKRMLAEQLEDSRDTRIFHKFGMTDLDLDSLHAYRNLFAALKPGHPWVESDDVHFLRLIGAWREDRQSEENGLTLAGLLMFGHWPSIAEAAPLYFVDYQEQEDAPDTETRWLDRVIPDGAWSGNLFDFYRKVIRKLSADLKVPFVLKGDTRIDDTPIHQVLREALVNTLVHADYSDRASVRIIKRPSGFEFRNPGLLRVTIEQALHGGESDCRNRTLQQMFLMINLGERAGSGLPKIRAAWEAAGHSLTIFDTFEPFDQTKLKMSWAAATPTISTEAPEKTSVETSVETSTRILQLLRKEPNATAQMLARQLGLTQRAVELQIARLKAIKKLRRIGPNKGGHWEVLG